MNTIIKKMLLVGFALPTTACAHYPQQYSYYPSYGGYSSGYTIMHRNYYGERSDRHDYGGAYFPYHPRHDQYNARLHWDHDDSRRDPHERYNGHSFDHENNRQHNDDDDSRYHNFDHRNHH